MRLVEVEADRGTQPLDLVRDADDEQLGLFRAGIKLVRRRPTDEVLREALDSLDQDRSFDANERDDTAIALDREISPEIDFLVAGHTHLERALPRHNGSGYYFNSGTWARLIQIAREVRTDATKFKALFNRLKHGTMTQLDATPGVLLKRCTVVVLERQSTGATNGRLRNVVKTDQAIGWADVPNTTFERTS
jgi:hypothetical protein